MIVSLTPKEHLIVKVALETLIEVADELPLDEEGTKTAKRLLKNKI